MTKLNYLNDSYLYKSIGKFLETKTNDFGKAVILDETIFYPQGGGQPSDRGVIVSGDNKFVISDVRLDEDGIVWHFGEFENGIFEPGEEVGLEVDEERRILNTKNHSAGHLLDCAVIEMKLDGLEPIKGFHFPEGPNVEYKGVLENGSELISKLQEIIDRLVSEDIQVQREDLSFEQAESKGIWAPAGKAVRVVTYEGYEGCGCGGTHVNSTSEIGKITIRKIKSKKGKTKISYVVE